MHGLDITVSKRGGVYTATLPLRMKNGRTLMLRASCSVQQSARELGYEPAELGAAFNPADPEEWWRLIENEPDTDDDGPSSLAGVEVACLLAGQPEVGGKLWRRMKKRFKKFGKRLGKAFRRFAKSKVIRGIVKFGKRIIKSPIFTGLATALTGGLAGPALIAANAAVNIIDVAKKGKGSSKKKARQLVKAALHLEKQQQLAKAGKMPASMKRKPVIKDGPWEGMRATPEQERALDALILEVAKARKARALEEATAKRAQPIRVNPQPPAGDVQRWLVELGGLATWT